MHITDFLNPAAVEANLKASNKQGVLRELVGAILRVKPELDPNILVDTLQQREKLQSTGIGDGIAIPHCKLEDLDDIVACVGRSVEGVDFKSLDGAPSHLFFMLMVPASSHGLHLKALARVSRLCKDADIREALLSAEDAEAMYAIIAREDEQL